MHLLGIRYCQVSASADELASFLDQLGVPRQSHESMASSDTPFSGAIFPAGSSWIEVWQASDPASECTMLQLVVDDADAFAEHARAQGLAPEGPMDAHGERIYSLTAPNGLLLSFQSKLP